MLEFDAILEVVIDIKSALPDGEWAFKLEWLTRMRTLLASEICGEYGGGGLSVLFSFGEEPSLQI